MNERTGRPPRTWLRLLGAVLALLTLGLVLAGATVDRWFFSVTHPGTFDPTAAPPAPDYADPSSWAALPELDDAADVALPEHPAVDQRDRDAAHADVFYIHPTTWLGGSWNGPIDDPAVIEATERGGTLIQASAFNGCCAVYAPRYRQAHGHAFVRPSADGDAAVDVAAADLDAAFTAFLGRIGQRPFLIAGHSQGAALGARLIRERVASTGLVDRLVVAYLVGGPLRAEDVGLPVCRSSEQTGCVAAWNARGPAYEANGFEFDADDPGTMRDRLCVNPLSWRADEIHVPANAHLGAVFFDTPEPAVLPEFADAQCRDGALVLTTAGDLQRDIPSKVLLWLMGPDNYHPVEYQLYYLDLRRNAATRVDAWWTRWGGQSPQEREVDLGHLLEGVDPGDATFVLFDPIAGTITRHNPERARTRFLPASTYKIPHTLIALETGVASGADFELPFDESLRPERGFWADAWSRDHTLRSALQSSAYWYFQEIARRVGPERMQRYLDQFDYGNRSMGGGLDQFWLHGGLRISADEQVRFLERFLAGELGVSERSTRILREILVLEQQDGVRISGKTGTVDVTPTRELLWVVGFVERGERTVYFALKVEGEQAWERWGDPEARLGLVKSLLRELDVLPEETTE